MKKLVLSAALMLLAAPAMAQHDIWWGPPWRQNGTVGMIGMATPISPKATQVSPAPR